MSNNYLVWFPFKKDASIYEAVYGENIEHNDNKYDYVILNNFDVKEIKRYRSLLNDDGHILLLCDNKLSLNYLNGFKYNGKTFSVFDEENVYTKKEIEKYIKECKYKNHRFYYLYPLIDNIGEIFTDVSINKRNPISINNSLVDDNIVLFEDKKVYELLMNNDIAQYFANAFLIDISDDEIENNIDYVKISFNRRDEFKLYTIIDYKNNKVYKKSFDDDSHIKSIEKNNWSIGKLETLKYKFIDNYLECELIDGKTLVKAINDDIKLLDVFKENILKGEYRKQIDDVRFNKVFGEEKADVKLHWLDKANVDILLDNIFVKDDRWIIIDPEWEFDFDIPSEFVLYRSLKDSEYKDYLDFDKEIIDLFDKWDNHFVYNYVGTKVIDYKVKDIVDIQQLYDKSLEVDRARAIEESTIWKATKPLRNIIDKRKRK